MHHKLLSFFELFREIPDGDRALIAKAFLHKSYEEGDYLFKAPKICDELFFICEGIVRIMVPNEKGTDVTHFFLKENQFCTLLDSFEKEKHSNESIQAACPAEVLAIRKTDLLHLYGQLPYLKNLIEAVMHESLLEKIRIRNAYNGLDATKRYRQFLILQPEIALRVSQGDIASYLGITPQSLSRIRKSNR